VVYHEKLLAVLAEQNGGRLCAENNDPVDGIQQELAPA
jgi:hypothetical protein